MSGIADVLDHDGALAAAADEGASACQREPCVQAASAQVIVAHHLEGCRQACGGGRCDGGKTEGQGGGQGHGQRCHRRRAALAPDHGSSLPWSLLACSRSNLLWVSCMREC